MTSRSRRLLRVGVREQIALPAGHSFRLLRWDRDLADVQLVLGPGAVRRLRGEGTHWHYHQALELIYFETGEGTRFVGDQVASFSAGDVVLLGENLPHHWQTRGNSSGLLAQWHFPRSHPFWAFPETLALTRLFKSAGRGIRYQGPAAREIVDGLRRMARSGGPGRLGALLQVLQSAHSASGRDQEFLSSRSISLSAEGHHQEAMRSAMSFLLANFRDQIRLEEVLEVAGMSKATFSRQFKRHSGQTLSAFLQKVRVEAACRELAGTNKPVIDAALGSGFSQISFFNRVFRRVLGCSPTDYRSRRTARRSSG